MKIIENAFEKRVFYFHEFLYFLNTIEKKDDNSLQNIVYYIVDLLILFDQILIPSSHLIVSENEYEANFKKSSFLILSLDNLLNIKKSLQQFGHSAMMLINTTVSSIWNIDYKFIKVPNATSFLNLI